MSERSSRTLGLDLGDARIGFALSDALGLTAQPAGVLQRKNAAADLLALRAIVDEHRVARVVVGHPLLLWGVAGARALAAERFAAKLGASLGSGVAVDLWDERLTTSEARRLLVEDGVRRGRRREVIDAMAAALILQSWLDARAAIARDHPSE